MTKALIIAGIASEVVVVVAVVVVSPSLQITPPSAWMQVSPAEQKSSSQTSTQISRRGFEGK